MTRIASGVVDQGFYFVAVDSTDKYTREPGLSSFTVYRSRNGAAEVAMTTPTVTEIDATNMPGVYWLLCDEDMTIDAGDVEQEMSYHITQASMAPVTKTLTLFRPPVTAGNTLAVSTTGGAGAGHSGTAAAIANGTITLAAGHGLSATTILVRLTGGTAATGKSRMATYSGAGDVYNVDPAWNATVNGLAETLPSGTITYEAYPIPPSGTSYNVGQTGDSFARLGAPAGASVSADVAAVKVDTAAILVDTGTTLDGRIPAALVGGRMDSTVDGTGMEAGAVTAIQTGLATAAALATVDGIVDNLVSGIIYGAAVTGTLSTTVATSDLTGYANDQLIGRVIIWLSGDCQGEASDITDYASASGTLTFTALTTAPANTDTFKIV